MFDPGTYRVTVVHPDLPNDLILASFSWDRGKRSKLSVDIKPDPVPEWLTEGRVERLWIVSPWKATLSDLVLTRSSSDGVELSISVVTFDQQVNEGGLKFDELAARVRGCSEWFRRSGFQQHKGSLFSGLLSLQYKCVETQYWDIGNSWQFGYGLHSHSSNSYTEPRSVTIGEGGEIRIKPPSPTPLDGCLRKAMQAAGLIGLLTGQPVTLERVYGTVNGVDSEISAPWNQVRREIAVLPRAWLSFAEIESQFGELLAGWCSLYDSIPLALDHYRLAHGHGGSLEQELFGVITALESLHRATRGEGDGERCLKCRQIRRKSLESRLKELVQGGPELVRIMLPESKCAEVAATRNYLGHHSVALEQRALPRADWFFWCRRLTTVFEVSLLRELGIDDELLLRATGIRLRAIQSGVLGEWGEIP